MRIYSDTNPNVVTLAEYLKSHPEIVSEGIWVKCNTTTDWHGDSYVRVLDTKGRVTGEQGSIYYKTNVISEYDLQWALDHDCKDFPHPGIDYEEFTEFISSCCGTYERDLSEYIVSQPVSTVASAEFLPDTAEIGKLFTKVAGKDVWVVAYNYYSEYKEYVHVVSMSGTLVRYSAIPVYILQNTETEANYLMDSTSGMEELLDYIDMLYNPTSPDGYASTDNFHLYKPIEVLSTEELLDGFNEKYHRAIDEYLNEDYEDE